MLALDGRIRRVDGVLSMAMTAAQKGYKGIIVPLENADEAAVVQGLEVYGVGSLAQAVAFLSDLLPMEGTSIDIDSLFDRASAYEVDFSDVKGQESVKRALTIAAAGGHNVMMIGPPGAGKTMLTKRMATILPDMSLAEGVFLGRFASQRRALDCHTPRSYAAPYRFGAGAGRRGNPAKAGRVELGASWHPIFR
jgi:magnesium chelatase family protein